VKRSLILNSGPDLINRIINLVRDVLFGEIEIDETARRQLARSRARVHALATAQKSDTVRRKQLAQASSLRVLTLLLSAALPSLTAAPPRRSSPPPPPRWRPAAEETEERRDLVRDNASI
jgi:hypothetical protein